MKPIRLKPCSSSYAEFARTTDLAMGRPLRDDYHLLKPNRQLLSLTEWPDLEQGFTPPYCIEKLDAGQLYTLDVMPTLLEAMWTASAYVEGGTNEHHLLITDFTGRLVA